MSMYRVHFEPIGSLTVKVEADSPEDALEKVFDEMPSGICAQCGGWGHNYSLDLELTDTEPFMVSDEDGEEVWKENSYIDGLVAQIDQLRKENEALKAKIS